MQSRQRLMQPIFSLFFLLFRAFAVSLYLQHGLASSVALLLLTYFPIDLKSDRGTPVFSLVPWFTRYPLKEREENNTDNHYGVYVLCGVGVTFLAMVVLFVAINKKNRKASKLDIIEDNGGFEE